MQTPEASPVSRKKRILIAEDEAGIAELISGFLGAEGYDCTSCPDGKAAVQALCTQEFDALITDLRMPVMDGLALLSWIQEKGPSLPVLVMSAWADVESAVAAMKLGAADYLSKPFEADELKVRLEKSLRIHRLELEKQPALSTAEGLPASLSPAMHGVMELARRCAPTDAGILIRGESGTGKEVLARWIHQSSLRSEGKFVAINLGGIPGQLLESELFGHEKGAFTGADRRKTGLFELANRGTLFLDEIGDMPTDLQVKILRVIQEKKIQRLGSVSPIPLDLRIIAATHVDLDQAVLQGRFREDLLYRLKVVELTLPPLRERREDIPALVESLMITYRKDRIVRTLSPASLAALMDWPFRGNIRELENMVQRALILGSSPVLEPADFGLPGPRSFPAPANSHSILADRPPAIADGSPVPADRAPVPAGSPLAQADPPSAPADGSPVPADHPPALADRPPTLAEAEKSLILESLARNGGHRERTSAELGINRRTLLNKLKEYGIENP